MGARMIVVHYSTFNKVYYYLYNGTCKELLCPNCKFRFKCYTNEEIFVESASDFTELTGKKVRIRMI